MSVTGVASTSNTYQTSSTNPYAQVKQDFQNLGKALQSGNLSDAQQAFATLQQDSPTSGQPQGNQSSNASNPMQDLGNALQSGDLSGAQTAFAQMQKAGKGHGHRHHQESSQQPSQQPVNSGANINLTIRIQEITYSGQGTIGTPSNENNGDSSSVSTAVSVLS